MFVYIRSAAFVIAVRSSAVQKRHSNCVRKPNRPLLLFHSPWYYSVLAISYVFIFLRSFVRFLRNKAKRKIVVFLWVPVPPLPVIDEWTAVFGPDSGRTGFEEVAAFDAGLEEVKAVAREDCTSRFHFHLKIIKLLFFIFYLPFNLKTWR